MKRVPGLALIIVATAVAGLAGYFITWLVPRVICFSAYAVYAVFWSFLFLVVSTLPGVQQEITRATRAVGIATEDHRARAHVLVTFFRGRRQALVSSLLRVVGLIVVGGAILSLLAWVLGPAVFALLFPAEQVPKGWLLADLVASSAFVAALCVSGPPCFRCPSTAYILLAGSAPPWPRSSVSRFHST